MGVCSATGFTQIAARGIAGRFGATRRSRVWHGQNRQHHPENWNGVLEKRRARLDSWRIEDVDF